MLLKACLEYLFMSRSGFVESSRLVGKSFSKQNQRDSSRQRLLFHSFITCSCSSQTTPHPWRIHPKGVLPEITTFSIVLSRYIIYVRQDRSANKTSVTFIISRFGRLWAARFLGDVRVVTLAVRVSETLHVAGRLLPLTVLLDSHWGSILTLVRDWCSQIETLGTM